MPPPTAVAWQRTVGPVYERLFRRFFDAAINRLNSLLAQTAALQTEVGAVRAELGAVRAEIDRLRADIDRLTHLIVQDASERRDLEEQMRGVLSARWDDIALARRLAALEDRIAT